MFEAGIQCSGVKQLFCCLYKPGLEISSKFKFCTESYVREQGIAVQALGVACR